jgi:hypothetical protein
LGSAFTCGDTPELPVCGLGVLLVANDVWIKNMFDISEETATFKFSNMKKFRDKSWGNQAD